MHKALEKGIISPPSETNGFLFNSEINITRAEICKLVVEANDISLFAGNYSHFSDVEIDNPFIPYVMALAIRGIDDDKIVSGQEVNGEIKFYPYDSAKRAELAKIVVNTIKHLERLNLSQFVLKSEKTNAISDSGGIITDNYENDNSTSNATVLTDDITNQIHTLHTNSDKDYFKFTIYERTNIKFKIESAYISQMDVSINSTSLSTETEEQYKIFEKTLQAGTHYIKIMDKGNNAQVPRYDISTFIFNDTNTTPAFVVTPTSFTNIDSDEDQIIIESSPSSYNNISYSDNRSWITTYTTGTTVQNGKRRKTFTIQANTSTADRDGTITVKNNTTNEVKTVRVYQNGKPDIPNPCDNYATYEQNNSLNDADEEAFADTLGQFSVDYQPLHGTISQGDKDFYYIDIPTKEL